MTPFIPVRPSYSELDVTIQLRSSISCGRPQKPCR